MSLPSFAIAIKNNRRNNRGAPREDYAHKRFSRRFSGGTISRNGGGMATKNGSSCWTQTLSSKDSLYVKIVSI